MKKTLVSLWLFLACAAAWAVPTVEQVQDAVQQGHYAQAEDMMREVVEARPGSAKAHYLYAEILAHEGLFARASEEAALARQLDPEIRFTQPEKFQAFESLLEREQRSAQRAGTPNASFPIAAPTLPAQSQATGVPGWVWLAALGGVAFMLWRGFARSRATPAPGGSFGVAAAAPNNGYGSAPSGGFGGAAAPYANAPPVPPSGGLLKTGLAVAGGVAAGMMVDELLHRRQGTGLDALPGLQPGALDLPPANEAATELERRNVDFGNGNDWDAGSTGSDLAGSGSDDGGWD